MNSKQLKIYFLLLCISKEKIVSDSNTKEPSRRDFIYVATAAAGAAAAFALGKSYLQKAGDAIIPASGGPTISTREGGLIQGTVNDDIIMAPGIAGGSLRTETRSTPGTVVLSDSQIQKIANAVRDGASRATINLDGDKVSSRLQTPTVLNTLPGV